MTSPGREYTWEGVKDPLMLIAAGMLMAFVIIIANGWLVI